jgi:hypothetical protein
MFRCTLSVPSSRVKKSKKTSWPLKMVQICCPLTPVKKIYWPLRIAPTGCPGTSVKDHHSTLHNIRRRAQILSTSRWKPEITHLLDICSASNSDCRPRVLSYNEKWTGEEADVAYFAITSLHFPGRTEESDGRIFCDSRRCGRNSRGHHKVQAMNTDDRINLLVSLIFLETVSGAKSFLRMWESLKSYKNFLLSRDTHIHCRVHRS